MPTPALTPFPPPPTPADAPDVFALKAGTFVTAQVNYVPEQNAALTWQAQKLAETQAAKEAAATSAGHAADSADAAAHSATAATENGAVQVNLAKDQVKLAEDQVDLAQQKVANAKEQADAAAASANSAQAMAAAAGAAAGLPSLVGKAGKALVVRLNESGVDWADVGQKIGDTLFSARNPGSSYLPLNGGVYSQTAYAALFGIVGLISGSFAEVWAAVTSNAGSNAINAVETDGNGVWVAAGAAGAMVRSTDNGATWTAVTSGFGATDINGLACDRAGLWVAVGAAGKVSRSTDNGATWAAVTSGLTGTDVIYSVASDRNGTFVALFMSASSHGALRSINSGVAWASVVVNASAVGTYKGIATDRKGVWISTSSSTQYYRSTDAGATWTQIAGVSGLSTSRITTDGKNTWVAANSGSVAQAARSSDNGLTWVPVSTPGTLASAAVATDSSGTWLIGNTGATIYRSTDNGFTWSTTTVTGLTGGALSACFGKDGIAILGAASGVLRRSAPTYGYDTATQFKLPNQPAAIGLAAYIKAKDA
jgi:hypothetical protein